MKHLSKFLTPIIIIALIVLYSSVFVVYEGQRAMTLRLGQLIRNKQGQVIVYQPGFHFKIPFVVDVVRIDVRLKNLDAETSKIPTDQQKYLLVDYYGKWRINDIPLYYTRTGGYSSRAVMLLKQKCNDALRAAFGRRSLRDVVSAERLNIMNILKETANKSAKNLGIEVVDMRIKGIDLLQQVQESVFQRMRTEREKVATQYRYQGRALAEKIRAKADRKAQISFATAKREAQRLRAKGDLDAAQAYNRAYKQNAEFYDFYRSLLSYDKVFHGKNTVLMLPIDSPYMKYFRSKQSVDSK